MVSDKVFNDVVEKQTDNIIMGVEEYFSSNSSKCCDLSINLYSFMQENYPDESYITSKDIYEIAKKITLNISKKYKYKNMHSVIGNTTNIVTLFEFDSAHTFLLKMYESKTYKMYNMNYMNSILSKNGYIFVLTEKGVKYLPSFGEKQIEGKPYKPYNDTSTHYDSVIYKEWMEKGYFKEVKFDG